jgi:hypothetical protein
MAAAVPLALVPPGAPPPPATMGLPQLPYADDAGVRWKSYHFGETR